MLSSAQRNLIDQAALTRGVDEISFIRWADGIRRDAVELAREVLFGAEEERPTTTPKVTRAPATASAAPKKRRSVTQELVEKWAADYGRCADSDIDGLNALADSAYKFIEDPALLMYCVSMLTVHRIKRERLEARIAALETERSKAATGIVYRGIYDENETYFPGDIATHSGTIWFCHETTTARPGAPSWQLMVKSVKSK